MSRHLDRERILLLDWLRCEQRDPAFLKSVSESDLPRFHDAIARRFLDWAEEAKFAFELVAAEKHGKTTYEVFWTHRGASFVGFKQPAAEPKAEDALLAGCAALLENQWCRERLPK